MLLDVGYQRAGIIINADKIHIENVRESFLREIAATRTRARGLIWTGGAMVCLGVAMFAAGTDMAIHIGSQEGGVVNNVEGNLTIHGGQHGTLVSAGDAQQAVRQLREAIAVAPLDEARRRGLVSDLNTLEEQVGAPEPDRERAAGALERVTSFLATAGRLGSAATVLVPAIQTLAGWLGDVAAPVLRLVQ